MANETLQRRFLAATNGHLGCGLDRQQSARALALREPRIVETASNQEKVLTIGLAAAALAGAGKKLFIATLNDYCATRDFTRMAAVYDELGLSSAAVTSASTAQQRDVAYRATITYGTIREFGFDLLRQKLLGGGHGTAGSQAALIVDEADRVLLDEGQSPLVIHEPLAAASPEQRIEADCFRWAAAAARRMRPDTDYRIESRGGRVALTDEAIGQITQSVIPASLDSFPLVSLLHRLERAIWVDRCLQPETHYRLQQDAVVMISGCSDLSAGKASSGSGVLQAIEAKEGLPLSPPSRPIARLTSEQYVALLGHACGVTATAWEDRRAFAGLYALHTTRADRCRPARQQLWPALISHNIAEKWQQIAEETLRVVQTDRAVLLATRNANESQQLSAALSQQMIEHQIVEDQRSEAEAELMAAAGEQRRVTILTNAAGRGTDLQLSPQSIAKGGVHLVLTQPHAMARLDRQLVARCGPPEFPRSVRRCYCIDDRLLDEGLGSEQAELLRKRMRLSGDARLIARLFRQAQKLIQQQQTDRRMALAQRDARLAQSLLVLGLDPLLNPVFDSL